MLPLVIFTGVLVLLVLFGVARSLFGSAGAVLLAGLVGYCFGGPPGAGGGLIAGLVLASVTWVLGALIAPERRR